jgi:hypothetical protein
MKNKFFIMVIIASSLILSEYGCDNKEKVLISKEIQNLADNYYNLISMESKLPSSVLYFRVSELDEKKSIIAFEITSSSPMSITGFQGNISVYNQYSDNVIDFNIEINESISPKGSITASYNVNGPVFKYKLSDLKCNFKIRTLNFEDGYSFSNMNSSVHPGIVCCSGPTNGNKVFEDLNIEVLRSCRDDAKKFLNDQKSFLKKYYDYN